MIGFIGLSGVAKGMGALPVLLPITAFAASLLYKDEAKHDLSHMKLSKDKKRVMRKFMYDYEQEFKIRQL